MELNFSVDLLLRDSRNCFVNLAIFRNTSRGYSKNGLSIQVLSAIDDHQYCDCLNAQQYHARFTCSKLTIEALKPSGKYIQS